MSAKTLLRSFAGGEITPELTGRLDLSKYQTGLALARNFITLPHGPATRRPGFEFIGETRDSTRKVRLIPFQFSADQSAVVELGHQYVQFYVNGGALLGEYKVTVTGIAGNAVTVLTPDLFFDGDDVLMGGRFYRIVLTSSTTFNVFDRWGNAVTPTGTVVSRVFRLATPYTEDELFDIHFAQSADVITLVHPNHPIKELQRLSATEWAIGDVSFAPPLTPPTGLTVTETEVVVGSVGSPQSYQVTAVGPDGISESLPSAKADAANDLTKQGNYNTITWDGVDGADRYNVYKLRGGIYGYIGQVRPEPGSEFVIDIAIRGTIFTESKTVTISTVDPHGFTTGDYVLVRGTGVASFDGYWQITVTGSQSFTYVSNKKTSLVTSTDGTVSIPTLSLIDDNVLADTTTSPPEDIITLNSEAGEYPAAVTYHEQRRWFAGTTLRPQVLWATRTGTDANLTSSIPSRADDGMELRVAAAQYNQIRHLVPLADLMVLTQGGEFRVYADNAPAITPTSVTIKPQGYAGSSNVQPVVSTSAVLYVQAQGSRVRELSYNWESNAYRSVDVSIMAPHRFNGFTLTQLAYSRAPDQILWAVRDDGTLLGLTYVPDQQVYGWHAHDTDGAFESVAVVSEGNEDVLYAVVRRTVNGRTVRYVERLHTRIFTEQSAAFYVDSGLTYSGTPVTTLSGLWHLEGRTVSILTDGAVHPDKVVTGGAVALNYPASVVHVGLPFTSDMRTLPLALDGMQAAGQGTTKNVNKVHLRVSQSGVVKVGPDFTRLTEYPARAVSDPYGSPPAPRDGELSWGVASNWGQDAAMCVRQDLPLPLTVLSMTLELQTGG